MHSVCPHDCPRARRARFTATLSEATRAGVVVIEGLWWHRFHPGHRNVNTLTSAAHE